MKIIKRVSTSRTKTAKARAKKTPAKVQNRKISEKRQFRAGNYPFLIRFIDGYVVVSAPDFHFPVPALKRFDLEKPDFKAIGEMVYMTYLQVVAELKQRDAAELAHPEPSKAGQFAIEAPKTLSLSEASKVLGLKPHVVRSLADSGEIRAMRTQGSHRRFLRESVERYLSEAFAEPRE